MPTSQQDQEFIGKANDYVNEPYSKYNHNCYQLGVEGVGAMNTDEGVRPPEIHDTNFPNIGFDSNNANNWTNIPLEN